MGRGRSRATASRIGLPSLKSGTNNDPNIHLIDSGSCGAIVRGFTHDGGDYVHTAGGTWVAAAVGAARLGARASAVRGGKRMGWSGGGLRQGAGAHMDRGDAAVLFSNGGSRDRTQPDYAAGGRALRLGASRVRRAGRISYGVEFVGVRHRGDGGDSVRDSHGAGLLDRSQGRVA